MTDDFLNFSDEELSVDNVLFTDVVVQLIGAWLGGDIKVVHTVVDSISEEFGNNETVMVGLLFASMLHMSKMIGDIAELRNQDMDEAWIDFLQSYNTQGREVYSQIPILHPILSERLAKEIHKND